MPKAQVYLDPLGIDALNSAMRVRAYLSRRVSGSESAQGASEPD